MNTYTESIGDTAADEWTATRALPFELEWPGNRLADHAPDVRRAIESQLGELVQCVDLCAAALQLHTLSDDLLAVDRAQRTLDAPSPRDDPDELDRYRRRSVDRSEARRRWSGGLPPTEHAEALGMLARHGVVSVLSTVDIVLGRLCDAPYAGDEIRDAHAWFREQLGELHKHPVGVATLMIVRDAAQRAMDAQTWRGPRRAHPRG